MGRVRSAVNTHYTQKKNTSAKEKKHTSIASRTRSNPPEITSMHKSKKKAKTSITANSSLGSSRSVSRVFTAKSAEKKKKKKRGGSEAKKGGKKETKGEEVPACAFLSLRRLLHQIKTGAVVTHVAHHQTAFTPRHLGPLQVRQRCNVLHRARP